MNQFKEINRQLLPQLRFYLSQWLPDGRIEGNEYVARNPKRMDRHLGSFRVNLRTGRWGEFATGDAGHDIVSLYAYLKGVRQSEAIKELAGIQKVTYTPPKAPKVPKTQAVHAFAIKLWHDSVPIFGTAAECYLRNRGIECEIPDALRFLQKTKHSPSNTLFPCMLAAITRWPGNNPIAIHRTYLREDGMGKAAVEPNKMMLGSTAGGAVRFGDMGNKLVLAEGIETALSVYTATGFWTWATLSTSGLAALILPPLDIVQELVIAADHDRAGIAAAQKAAQNWKASGYVVRLALPPREGMDFNDLLREGVA